MDDIHKIEKDYLQIIKVLQNIVLLRYKIEQLECDNFINDYKNGVIKND